MPVRELEILDESDFYLYDSEVPRAQRVREIGENIVGLFLQQGMRLGSIGLAQGGIDGIGAASFAQQPHQNSDSLCSGRGFLCCLPA